MEKLNSLPVTCDERKAFNTEGSIDLNSQL